jgi:hypothetical protein
MESTSPPVPDPTQSKPRRFYPTPAWLLFILLLVEGALLLSQRFQFFSFNTHKGWTVLIAIASIGVTMVLMLLWFLLALCFRWRFQFSLRAMMVLTVAVPFSWLATELKKAREQREVANAIRDAEGSIIYDFELDGNMDFVGNPQFPAPLWLFDLFDEFFFTDIGAVVLADSQADATLERLTRLTQLKWLSLRYNVAAKHLEQLKGLTQLKQLFITDISDGDDKAMQEVLELRQALPLCDIMPYRK